MAKIVQIDSQPTYQGLQDGGKKTLKCSSCRQPLVVIWITRPNEKLEQNPIIWKLKAQCCYCNKYSYEEEIVGGFHYKGYGEDCEDIEMDIPKTVVSSVDEINGVFIFKTKEVK